MSPLIFPLVLKRFTAKLQNNLLRKEISKVLPNSNHFLFNFWILDYFIIKTNYFVLLGVRVCLILEIEMQTEAAG
jgi:hypothetical protein